MRRALVLLAANYIAFALFLVLRAPRVEHLRESFGTLPDEMTVGAQVDHKQQTLIN